MNSMRFNRYDHRFRCHFTQYALLIIVVSFFLSVCGCGNVEADMDEEVDQNSMCEDAPLETWATFGQSFAITYCQGCHASTAANRYGAPQGINFDTRDEVLALGNRILTVVTSDTATMPPNGGISAEDLTRLELWLRCTP